MWDARELTSQPPSGMGDLKLDRLVGPLGQPHWARQKSTTLANVKVGIPSIVLAAIAANPEVDFFRARVCLEWLRLFYKVADLP